jgi:hypothetical protein
MHHIVARGRQKKLQLARRVSRAQRVFASHQGFCVTHTTLGGEKKRRLLSLHYASGECEYERGAVNRSSSTLPPDRPTHRPNPLPANPRALSDRSFTTQSRSMHSDETRLRAHVRAVLTKSDPGADCSQRRRARKNILCSASDGKIVLIGRRRGPKRRNIFVCALERFDGVDEALHLLSERRSFESRLAFGSCSVTELFYLSALSVCGPRPLRKCLNKA